MSIDRLKLIDEEIDRRLNGEAGTLDLTLSKLFDISFKLHNIKTTKDGPKVMLHPNDNIEPAR